MFFLLYISISQSCSLMIALICFHCRIGFSMPKIVGDSLFIIYTTAVGLSMFASGTNNLTKKINLGTY